MESHRKRWNKRQTEFRDVLLRFDDHPEAIRLFRVQHAQHHTAAMAGTEPWSFEDFVLADMAPEAIRRIPRNTEHSVAWLIWHIARIEDVAMNLLVAGSPQVFAGSDWANRLGVPYKDTGNAMESTDVAALSATIDLQALRDYRCAVGRRTRAIVQGLEPEFLKQTVDPLRLQQVLDEGAVRPTAQGLIDYWGRRTIAGLLLMPPTRHCFVHLNEALKIKRRRE